MTIWSKVSAMPTEPIEGVAWRRRTLRGAASSVGRIALLFGLPASLPCLVRRSPDRMRGFRQSLLGKLGAVVQLLDVHGARGAGFDAELAEDALVAVLGDDLDGAVGVLEDVDGADFFELGREGGVARDRVLDGDVDEDLVQLLGHQAPIFSLTTSGISSMRSTTRMPAASRRE